MTGSPYEVQRNTGNRSHENPDSASSIQATCYGMIGVTDVDIQLAFIMIVGFIVLLTVFSLVMLHKGTGIKN